MDDLSTDKASDQIVHRRAQRTTFAKQTVVHLWPVVDEPAVAVSILDFSPFGIGFVCDAPLERGQQFTMELTPANGPSAELLYSVAYCHPTHDGQFRIGSEFTCVVSDAPKTKPAFAESDASLDRIRRAILA
jgi:hypothetical protein